MSTPINTLPNASAASVEDLCDFLARTHEVNASPLCEFARLFFAQVPRRLLTERRIDQLAAVTESAFRFLERSRPTQVNVEVTDPEEDAMAWEASVTVIRVEVGDRPFIVDTIREFLAEENIEIHAFLYPVFRVDRGSNGEILDVGEPTEEGNLEALIHCEVPQIVDAERRARIASEIRRRLTDVVASTSDFSAMLSALNAAADTVEGYQQIHPDRAEEYREAAELLRWLPDGNFVFLGYRAYDVVGEGEQRALVVDAGSGLGILRGDRPSRFAQPVPFAMLPESLRKQAEGGPVLVITKAESEATVHRRARMDYVGLKKLDAEGRVVGEQRFLGLFTSKAHATDPADVPILRSKLARILSASDERPESHDYKEIISIFNSIPKEELFAASTEDLLAEVQTVLALLFTDSVKVTVRPDPLRRGASVMVVLPRGRYSGELRQQVQEVVAHHLRGTVMHYSLAMGEHDRARLHFHLVAPSDAVRKVDLHALERDIQQRVRSWEEELRDRLGEVVDPATAMRLAGLYGSAVSDEYRAQNKPAAAVTDIIELERMRSEGRHVSLCLNQGVMEKTSRLTLYLEGERLVLSDFIPILEDAGIRTIEVNPATISGPELPPYIVYTFTVQRKNGEPIPQECAAVLSEALLAARAGDAPTDAFSALTLNAGLRWREADVLRIYGHYAAQIGAVASPQEPARALSRYPEVARLLVQLFHARLDPAGQGNVDALCRDLATALESVRLLADDRALRRLQNLIMATVRTNYFRNGGAQPTRRSGGVPYLSIKIRCADVEELKKSRLLYEVYVHSARMEGIHLRGAAVSRGGIRWSDRHDDFRTEILGLVTTQVVKNAVIVPSGSKGGFVTKRSFPNDRDAMLAEAAEQYKTLMRGLLDITDNLVNGKVVPPPDVVRHDGDDPYLVVAADKGTAHLSDTANAVAAEYDFWLGDAFASGGSQGYDHKKEGITARGAWECVKRHFREMNKDIQTEPFTVAGIGDMSGDVFGNGMLLSRQIRLLAAFDHRHIFLDPDPDPEASYQERERLFKLPRSSWEDYNRALLSPGGMIVPRASKEIEITPEVRQALGIDDADGRLDGEALIRAVLRAPVELLWNGGIGTYVKHSEETHADAGDSANDPVRIDANELRCQVVGEGGNLGFTQRARVSYALEGGRINTDALDNSAGVDMSDHEVNLKILLRPEVASGRMTLEQRNQLLGAMTDEVNALVLRHNISQSLAVSLDGDRSRSLLDRFAALITALERGGQLERGAEGLPSSDTLHERATEGYGLTRPTLSVLLAYAKLQAKAQILDSPLPDDPAAEPYLVRYFPRAATEAVGLERLRQHRLRREIITTALVNDLVDIMGASFLHRTARDTGYSIAAVARAWLIASRVARTAEVRADLEAAEARFPAETVYRWYLGLARVLERTTHWLLDNITPDAPTVALIDDLSAGFARVRGDFAGVVHGTDRETFLELVAELETAGVDRPLAERLITLRFLPELLEILHLGRAGGADPMEAAQAFYLAADRFGTAMLRQRITDAVGTDPWERRHARVLVDDIARAQRALTRTVLARCTAELDARACIAELERTNGREIEAYRTTMQELDAAGTPPLAAYALAVRALGDVAGE